MTNKEYLNNFDYEAIINLLKTATQTLEKGVTIIDEFEGEFHNPVEKSEVKKIVSKLTEQLNLLIEEKK